MFKKIFLMVMIVLVLIGMMMVTFWFFERQAMHHRQYQLLCKELVFGMSEDEVLNVLNEKGIFKQRYFEFKSNSHYDIWYLDSASRELYGDFAVYFSNGEYWQAVRPAGASDFNFEIICSPYD
jgi:hypothetical protein